jgi:hypothetical protein
LRDRDKNVYIPIFCMNIFFIQKYIFKLHLKKWNWVSNSSMNFKDISKDNFFLLNLCGLSQERKKCFYWFPSFSLMHSLVIQIYQYSLIIEHIMQSYIS